MKEFSEPLATAIKRVRCALHLTQNQLAEKVGIDPRTILNIENCKGNPKMEVLYPLVRFLKIDANEIFFPEERRDTPAFTQLQLVISDCSEEEAAHLIPILQAVLAALRSKRATDLE